MKLLVISGSRNPEGKTAAMAASLVKGASAQGVESETIFLPRLTIERCRQCDEQGWGECREKGACVIDDDLASILEKCKAADAVVFANPVYFGDLSESMRALLDRFRRISRHKPVQEPFLNKKAIGICMAGGGGGGTPTCIVSLEKVLSTCGFDVVDLVPVRRQNLDLKEKVLETTGAWLAEELVRPKDTK